jgi:hypothetical protein
MLATNILKWPGRPRFAERELYSLAPERNSMLDNQHKLHKASWIAGEC